MREWIQQKQQNIRLKPHTNLIYKLKIFLMLKKTDSFGWEHTRMNKIGQNQERAYKSLEQ